MPVSIHASQPEITLNEREQIQYLLGGPPSWMMRYGITVLAAFFILLLTLAYLIRYPDVLECKIVLSTHNPPIRVVAPAGGRIERLAVRDGQSVQAGELVAVLENPASWEDVLRLERWLASDAQESLPEHLTLGSLQGAYSTFSQNWQDAQYFQTRQNAAARIVTIRKQMAQLEKIQENLRDQHAMLTDEFQINTAERKRQQDLHGEKVISDQAFEKSEALWISQKRQIAAAEATMLQNQMQMQQLGQQIQELSMTASDQMHEKGLQLAESKEQLRSALAAWKQNFLVFAPIRGVVSFTISRSVHQSVAAGDELLAVIPDRSDRIVGKSTVAAASIGKIQPGARAVIYLDAWPVQQYGSLEGRLSNISSLPQDAAYLVEVSLPDSLVTTYQKTIPFRQEMSGQVRIITEERRVLARIFDRLNDLLKNN
jgi:multidrug resistance efflux pump